MPDTDLRLLRATQREMEQTLAERDRVAGSAGRRGAEIARLEAEIARAAGRGDAAAAGAMRAEREQLAAARRDDLARLRGFDDALRRIAGGLARRVDECDADPLVPLLLLPVRLETRYTADRRALRVRVYPDDVHIDQLDPGLDDAERGAWQEYWTAVWAATDARAEDAWRLLVQRVGARRAMWLAVGLTPTNLAARGQDAMPAFGEVGPRQRRAAVARLLPDSFVAVAVQGADRRTAVGLPIAPEVTVGLLADDGSKLEDVGGLKVMPGAEWAVNYDAALAAGMAVTVPLARPGERVDQLVVMGVRRTLAPARAAAELERLLLAHRCTRGLAIVPQGAPTNNTETDRPAWRAHPDAARPPHAAPPPADGSNAQLLAAALGVGAPAFAGVSGGELREQPHARATNAAFWGATWGPFLEKANMLGPDGATLGDRTVEAVRAFHRDAVRGRGPLPALRVGNQPYGVLPVSATGAAHWRAGRGDVIENGVLDILRRARGKWRQAAAELPRVGAGRIDEVMRELLGTSPVSIGLRVRTVLSDDAARVGLTVSNGDPAALAAERLIEELMLEELVGGAGGIAPTGSLATASRPLALPLAHDGDVACMDALLAGAEPPKVTSVWQALLQLSWKRAQREVDESGGRGRFPEIVRQATHLAAADRDRVSATVGSADRLGSRVLREEAERVRALTGVEQASATLSEYQPVAATRRGFGELALTAAVESARPPLAGLATWAHLDALARRAELREAMTELRSTTRDERRTLLAETLDCASHRLDAWCTGVVERRRSRLRAATPVGVSVGAYGWVEGIEPTGDRLGDGGYVHAPSLAHAATAGILRSAYLAHNAAAGGSGAFAIDLTSERVRTALHLVDGVRQGQPLPALLGYRIERAIHEVDGLDRLVLSLRTIAPLSQGKLTDRGETPSVEAIEALAASNVTDGVDLIEKYQGKIATWGPQRVRDALDRTPKNPYLNGTPWPRTTDAEWAAVRRIIEDAAQACDAVADLLAAEAVHQLVQGNMARASAALDAAGGGDAPPPHPAVVATPIEGVPLTHRILLVASGAGRPWNGARPRAAAEPRLEAWAGARLGDPAMVRAVHGDDGAARTLADAGLSALDVVYAAGDRALFDQRVRAALGLAADVALAAEPADGWPAGTRALGELYEHASALRTLLANARPAAPGDLARPNDPDSRPVSRADLEATLQRATLAHGGLRALATALAGQLAAVPLDEAGVRTALDALAGYGVVGPTAVGEQLGVLGAAALSEASRRVDDAERQLAAATAALAQPDSPAARARARDAVVATGQALFGDGFWLVPALDAPAEPDLWQAALAPGALSPRPGEIRRFLADAASVREPARRVSDALLLAEAVGAPAVLRVAQLAPEGAEGTSRWVGGALDAAAPSPAEPVTSVVLDAPAEYDGTGATVALAVDQWADVVPLRERRGREADAPVDERATSGVCFNANAPSARAPQAMLLAVSPNGERWTSDALLHTLLETLDLAKARLVTLERTNGPARVLPAIYQQSWSLQGEPALDFRFVSGVNYVATAVAAFVKE